VFTPSKLEKTNPLDTSARNRALVKFAEKLGIAEVASRLHIQEARLRLYMHGGTPVPDPVWLLFVDQVLS
jgi:hypothetical protein